MNIITVSSEWILQKIAERIRESNSHDSLQMTVSHSPSNDVDINFYVDITNCFKKKSKVKDVGLFTHLDRDLKESFQQHWKELDFILHMNRRYYQKFIEIGYPKEQMDVLTVPIDTKMFPLKKIKIGVFQRGGFEGKGYYFMQHLLEEMNLQNFHFLFVGKGWDDVIGKFLVGKVRVDHETDEDYEDYPRLYEKIDYLLIPSLWEGGPMNLLEALSCGIPIIAANVGMVPEFKVDYMFEVGNMNQLMQILKKIESERIDRRKQVENITWEDYTKRLFAIFEEVLS